MPRTMNEDSSLVAPLLGGAPGNTESLDTAEPSPKPKPQRPSPPVEPLEMIDTEQPAGRAAVVMTPDGSVVPVSSTASLLPSGGRTEVRHQPTVPYTGGSALSANLPHEEPLPPKPDGAPGPAPSGGPYHPQTYAGATPGPPLTSPIPGPAPDHMQQKSDTPVPGPAPDGHPQQTPAQHMHPAAQPMPQYPPPQPYNHHQFPYQPYRPVQYTAPGPTVPVRNEQPNPQREERKPFRTSKTLNCVTIGDNQYYISICLCILLIIVCNPLAMICCISAFYFASKAVKENENDNYDKALSLENKAKVLNIGGFLLLVIYGLGFIFIAAFGGGSAGAYLT